MALRELPLAVREQQQQAREQHVAQMLSEMRSTSSQARREEHQEPVLRDAGMLPG